jgi:hypothetical protein
MLARVSFEDALRDNRVPRLLGDVTLRYDAGRLVGESLPPPWGRRLLPGLCVTLAAGCALGATVLVLVAPGGRAVGPAGLTGLAVAFVGFALHLEARLRRRRFVLHFRTESLRLETLAWAPGATRTETVPFDAVRAVQVVEGPGGRYSLRVEYGPEAAPRRALLVSDVRPSEAETLHRVWRMLHNAFGLRGAGLAGG